jgi:GntR family transcriptional regulator
VIAIIVVDLRNPKPIYEQIKDKFKQLIVSGALSRDERLPSVRELAQATSINPTPYRRPIRIWRQKLHLFCIGKGNFVAAPPQYSDPRRIEELKAAIRNAAGELFYLGLTKEEILSITKESIPEKRR